MSGLSVADANGFVYEPMRGPKRKIEFRERSDEGLERIEAVCTGCNWRVTRREVVLTMRHLNTAHRTLAVGKLKGPVWKTSLCECQRLLSKPWLRRVRTRVASDSITALFLAGLVLFRDIA